MATKGGEEEEAVLREGKTCEQKENTVRRTRGRPRKNVGEVVEALAMKRFLGKNKGDFAFVKGGKVVHSPKKKTAGGSALSAGEGSEDGKEEGTHTDGEQASKDGDSDEETAKVQGAAADGAVEEKKTDDGERVAVSVRNNEAWNLLSKKVEALEGRLEQVIREKGEMGREIADVRAAT